MYFRGLGTLGVRLADRVFAFGVEGPTWFEYSEEGSVV